MDVTVIVPFRNRGMSRLKRAIDSLAGAAPGLSLQVIVSDFGSDDPEAVQSVCTVVGAEWLRTESDHWNKSVCVNRALRISRGKYVQIHDVDMIWTPGSLTAHVQAVESKPYSFVNSQVWDLPEDLTEYALETSTPDWDLLRERAVSHSRWGHGLVLAPTSALLQIGGLDERMHTYGGEDLDLTKRLMKAGLRQEWVGHRGDELFHIWHKRIPSAATSDKRIAEAIQRNRDLYYQDDTIIRNVIGRGTIREPLVSVVIATRDRSAFLADAIYSALYQTMTDLEVIVVDDGSSDDTEAVVRSIDDPRVRYVRQEASGVAAARNNGTRHARGSYIAVLDDDDLMRPDRLEIQLGSLDGESHGCVGNLLHFYDASGETYYFSDAPPTVQGALPTGGFAGHPSWLVEKSLLQQVPYDETLTSAIDNNVALRALRSGFRFRHCHQFLTLRRIHAKQVTSMDGHRQKLGARLTHVWFRAGIATASIEKARNDFNRTVERAENAAETSAALRPWLPDHLVSRTVRLQSSTDLEETNLPLPERASSAVSIITESGEQLGTPIQIDGVTWPQLVSLRRHGIAHHVVESASRTAQSRHGLALAAPVRTEADESHEDARQAISAAAERIVLLERDKLEPHEFLICWQPASDDGGDGGGIMSTSDLGTASYRLSNRSGTRLMMFRRCSDFTELIDSLGRAHGLIQAFSPTARLHLSYIHRKATELGVSA